MESGFGPLGPSGIMAELGRYMDPAHLQLIVNYINEQATAAGKGALDFEISPRKLLHQYGLLSLRPPK